LPPACSLLPLQLNMQALVRVLELPSAIREPPAAILLQGRQRKLCPLHGAESCLLGGRVGAGARGEVLRIAAPTDDQPRLAILALHAANENDLLGPAIVRERTEHPAVIYCLNLVRLWPRPVYWILAHGFFFLLCKMTIVSSPLGVGGRSGRSRSSGGSQAEAPEGGSAPDGCV